jgi:hypothetical protein
MPFRTIRSGVARATLKHGYAYLGGKRAVCGNYFFWASRSQKMGRRNLPYGIENLYLFIAQKILVCYLGVNL